MRARDETAEELIRVLRFFFCTYGVPEEIATDGAIVYVGHKTQKFLLVWGVKHCVSSAYFPHSNLRAETCVKSMKWLITSNVGPKGNLDCDTFAAALMTYRNTPDRDNRLSPAQILYARKLRDSVPTKPVGFGAETGVGFHSGG